MSAVSFTGVTKSYKDGPKAVDDLTLNIADGEFMVLVGPSGCGKSTALRMIAGLEEISGGTLQIGDTVVNDIPPGDRDIAMVFQNYALYPHMTVRENIGFALTVARVSKDEIKRRTDEAAELLGLTEYVDRLPKALSGGQRQRVAMGRAIVRSPQVFLMDEPLSNLDAKLRVQMRSEIIELQARLGTTMVYVTHDQVEAMTMGHRVAVMRKGLLQQVAPPQELYLRPANLFVAAFIGSPAMNLLPARIDSVNGRITATFAEHTITIDQAAIDKYSKVPDYVGRDVVIGIRPEHFAMAEDTSDPAQTIEIKSVVSESMGSEVHVHATVDVPPVALDGQPVNEDADANASTTKIIARVEGFHIVRMGQIVRLAIKTAHVHFFDATTGAPLRDDDERTA